MNQDFISSFDYLSSNGLFKICIRKLSHCANAYFSYAIQDGLLHHATHYFELLDNEVEELKNFFRNLS